MQMTGQNLHNQHAQAGLKITAGHWSNTGQIFNLTGQRELWPVKLAFIFDATKVQRLKQALFTKLRFAQNLTGH